jgi:CMP/dCMP kinase
MADSVTDSVTDLTGRAARRIVVAIDGPSGSGKSTVSRRVAERLGLDYLDTGAIYRALTWWCLEQGVDLSDPTSADRVTELARTIPLELGTDPSAPAVQVAGRDIAAAIREPRISTQVSAVATNLAVRAVLRVIQRRLIAAGPRGCVAEGRDITTVIAPDADVRILLTADTEARLGRRAVELHGAADEQALAATRDQVVRRDRDDSTVSSFMSAAEGVRTIDSSTMSLAEVVDTVLAEVAARTGVRAGDVHA